MGIAYNKRVWKTEDGRGIEIGEMVTEHIINCVNMLRRHIKDLPQPQPPSYYDHDDIYYSLERAHYAKVIERKKSWIEDFNRELRHRGVEAL